jgi:hypothetical protein
MVLQILGRPWQTEFSENLLERLFWADIKPNIRYEATMGRYEFTKLETKPFKDVRHV